MFSSATLNGVGLGLRFKYLSHLIANRHKISWVELLADNFHDINVPIAQQVTLLCNQIPCVLHAVNFSLASTKQLNKQYLDSIKNIVKRFNPLWVSDHLCFTHIGNIFLHELLPFPFTQDRLNHIAHKIDIIQNTLNLPFLIENISSYLRFKDSEMTESEFINQLVKQTGCGILLDVNNIVVTCHNHNESIDEFCNNIPFAAVKQIHLAGSITHNNLLVDSHSRPLNKQVIDLFSTIIKKYGNIPACLEWDLDLPEFATILAQVNIINDIYEI
jgi:uncharacterized protein (UPF0276 family)